jgi:YfiH family protein
VFSEISVFAERLPGDASRQFRVLCYDTWRDRGITHGFIGRDGFFRGEKLSPDLAALAQGLSSNSISYLKQTHSAEVLMASSGSSLSGVNEGDGWVINVENDKGCWVIFTADCLPLMISFGKFMALLHAGWRGLANGIVVEGVNRVLELSGNAPRVDNIEMVIGPAASKDCYEVGNEVLDQIGPSAVSVTRNGRVYLSLAETAAKQFREAATKAGVTSRVYDCAVCTIDHTGWHSHRRDQQNRGSNVMFFSAGGRISNEFD